MQVTIWGARGSIPTPGPETVNYGGNTSCIEVALENGAVFVLDAGTGIRQLGNDLQERGTERIQLLLTHLHLDHLEGLRFFAPLFDERVTIDVWGPRSPIESLRRPDQALLLAAALPDRPARDPGSADVSRRAEGAVVGRRRDAHLGSRHAPRAHGRVPDRG